ncbi:MAG TPA: restriction endonuclease [Longimicrobiaceae bacterium]|nr:restriction endonuclease [Longimicrobiaceae bacterium]
MANYDFTALSSYDFELFVADLLEQELGIPFEAFTPGPDQGIDLRAARSADGRVIVQCKHVLGKDFRAFLLLLEKELSKVKKIIPERYILVTSLGLTPKNKDQVYGLFSEYMKGTGDVLGRTDLNVLLTKFPNVEQRTLKLWLTSKAVLDKVLHSGLLNRSVHDVEDIKRKLCTYVQNQSYSDALELLSRFNFCLIAGIPGIGKSTLAEVLCIYHLDLGFEVYSLASHVGEAFTVLDTSRKQLFYYDDFLGQTSLSDKLRKNEDQDLLRLIEVVKHSSNTRLLLTTREYILNQARQTYEKLARADLDFSKCTIDLADYTLFQRAQILFNHLFFFGSPQVRQEIVRSSSYLRIVQHRNYNPRIVEWMIHHAGATSSGGRQFIETFIESLDNPRRIWMHAFEEQILATSRSLLLVMVTLPPEIFLEDLLVALYAYIGKTNPSIVLGAEIMDPTVRRSLQELEGTFIKTNQVGLKTIVTFHNPSIRDFLKDYLFEYPTAALELINSAAFFHQVSYVWDLGAPYYPPEMEDDDYDEDDDWRRKDFLRVRYQRVIKSSSDIVVQSFLRLLDGPVCHIRLSEFSKNLEYYHDHESWIGRVSDLCEAVCMTRLCQSREEILGPILDRLITGLHDYEAEDYLDLVDDRGGLLELIGKVESEEYGLAKWQDRLFSAGKEVFLSADMYLREFQWYLDFSDEYYEKITQKDLRVIRRNFRFFLDEWMMMQAERYRDAGSVYSYLSDLCEIAEDLGVGIKRHLTKVRKYAESLPSNPKEDVQRAKAGTGRTDAEHAEAAVPAIRSLFSTLNDA